MSEGLSHAIDSCSIHESVAYSILLHSEDTTTAGERSGGDSKL